jgi:hypothetical protein
MVLFFLVTLCFVLSWLSFHHPPALSTSLCLHQGTYVYSSECIFTNFSHAHVIIQMKSCHYFFYTIDSLHTFSFRSTQPHGNPAKPTDTALICSLHSYKNLFCVDRHDLFGHSSDWHRFRFCHYK